MKKQKLIAFLAGASIVSALVFSSCGLYQNSAPRLGNPDGELMETGHKEQVTLHFMYCNSFPKEIFARFTEKYPHIKVEFEQFGRQHYPDVQQVRLSSGENVDLMEVMETDYQDFVEKGYLEDISGMAFLQNYRQDALDALGKLNPSGKLYAVPYKSSTLGIWYNKILFNKYGLKVPDSYGKLVEACKVFKANGVAPMVIGAKDEWRGSDVYYIRLGNAAHGDLNRLEKLSTGELKWLDAEVIKSFEEVGDFIHKGYLLGDSINLTNRQAFNEFARGRAAMFLTDDSSLDMIEPGIEKVCDLGVFPIPYNDAGQNIWVPGSISDFRIGIFKGSAHKEEAELLLDYLSQPEAAQYYVNETKSNSTLKNVNFAEVKYNELWKPLREGPFLAPMAVSLGHDSNERLNRLTRELMVGLKTPRELLKEMDENNY